MNKVNPLQAVKQGINLLYKGQVQQAAQISSRLLEAAGDLAHVHYLACEVALARGELGLALEHINRAIEISSEEPALRLKKARIELGLRRGVLAQETVLGAVAPEVTEPEILLEAARILGECNNHRVAEQYLVQAIGQRETADILFEFARNQLFLGRIEQAERAIASHMDRGLPVNGQILLLRSQLQKQTADSNHVPMLRNYLDRKLPQKESVYGYFALAKELEDLGEYAQSFEARRAGAALKRRQLQFSLADELNNIDGLINTFQPPTFAAVADSGRVDAPIFILGMPRTGTTLVERILGKHGDVRSGGETQDFTLAMSEVIDQYIASRPGRGLNPMSAALEVDFGCIADRYLNLMEGMLGPSVRYLDKFPFNFLYCGLIRKAFPRARIVHVVRDPMDTCYAVFQTLFHQVCSFSYDLDEIADYYIAYRRLMDHWHKLMPGAILDLHYEALVSNPGEESKRLADFVGIEWSENLIDGDNISEAFTTASAAQVRQPIHAGSIQKWRNYATELEPVKQKLQAAGLLAEPG